MLASLLQGLAYAMLAGLPPVVGLYTAAMAPMVYSVLGTSTVCSIGPNALVRATGFADRGHCCLSHTNDSGRSSRVKPVPPLLD